MAVLKLAAAPPPVKSPFLEGLAPQELNTVLAAARQCHFRAGTVVATQGTPADSLFLIVRGRARYFVLTPEGHKIILLWLPEGEVFGGAAMQFHLTDYIVSTETVRDSTMLQWDRATTRRLVARYPRLLDNALITATEYLTFYVATHIALTCHTAPERLAAVLLNLAEGIGHHSPRGVELDVTNEELAEAANLTPFTASRLISEWHRRGALVKSRGKVLLRSPGRLFLARVS